MRELHRLAACALALGLLACPPKGPPPEPVALDADAAWFGEEEPEMPVVSDRVAAPVICGEIRLSGEIAAAQPTAAWSGAWLMLFARKAPGGPVIAGVRTKLPSRFPVKFCLSQKNVIVQNQSFAGALWLTARIDGDGKPELDPGDYDGSTKAAVPVGTRNALVVIDTFR